MALATESSVAARVAAQRPGRWLLPVILLGNMLNLVDTFVVNVALPTLSRTLHAGSAELEFVVTGYVVAYACLLVVGGRLGDTFGRRRMYLIGMAGFVIASAACGFAPSAPVLVAARVVQGAAGALVVPQTLALIQVNYQGQARQRALGIFGAVNSVAAAAGQILGGYLVSADLAGLSWRPAFLVNIPVGVVGLLLGGRLIAESRAPRPAPIDARGATLLGGALVLLLIPLAVGREQHWPGWCWAMLVLAPVVAVAFAAVEWRIERAGGLPLLPLSLLRLPGMRKGLVVCLAVFASFGAMMLTTTVSLQQGLHFGPLEAGLTLLPYTVAFLVGSLLARSAVARLGRLALCLGGLLFALASAVLAVQAQLDYQGLTPLSLAPAQIVMGLGQAVLVIPLVGLVLAEVPAESTGAASGVWATTQQSAVALGVAAVGMVFFTLAASRGFASATVAADSVEAVLALVAGLAALRLRVGR
jgi:EmrB/QacA subfamily drug resistance transporter